MPSPSWCIGRYALHASFVMERENAIERDLATLLNDRLVGAGHTEPAIARSCEIFERLSQRAT